VTGDKSRSFLTQGAYQQHNLNLRYARASDEGLSVNSQLSLQAHDDPVVIARRDKFKVLGGFFALEKPQNYRLEGGNIIPQASRATLTSAVLGLGGYYQLNAEGRLTRLTLIGGQVAPPLDGERFQRGVLGGTLTRIVQGDAGSLSLKGNLYRVEDLEGSIKNKLGLERLASFLYSLGADLRSNTGLGLGSELAFSRSDNGAVNGTSLWLGPSFQRGIFQAAANLERDSPRFINPVGSVQSDIQKADASLILGQANQLSLNGLYTQTNVEGQSAFATKTKSAGTAVKIVPFQDLEDWKPFSVGADFRLNDSETTGGVSKTRSQQAGLSLAYNSTGLNTTLRGEYLPQSDRLNAANDLKTYRATWQTGFKLVNPYGVTLAPFWNVTLERRKSLSSNLTSPSESVGAGVNATYSDWLTLGARHDFQHQLSRPGDRRVTNNATQVGAKFLVKTKAPIILGLNYYYKNYHDTALNDFAERNCAPRLM